MSEVAQSKKMSCPLTASVVTVNVMVPADSSTVSSSILIHGVASLSSITPVADPPVGHIVAFVAVSKLI